MRIFLLLLTFFATFPVVARAGEEVTVPAIKASPAPAAVAGQAEATTEDYICPMHHDVHGKKGDKGPICQMPLVLAQPDAMTPAPEVPETKSEGGEK